MARKQLSQEMQDKIKSSLLSYAIYRPESAAVIAMTILLMGLGAMNLAWFPGDWWLWLAFGLAGEGLIVLSTLRDKKFYQKLLDDMFKREFDLDKLRAEDLRQKLARAMEYHERLVREIEREEEPVLDDYLLNMAHGLEDWIAQVYHLARGLDVYRHDPIIARDMESVPQELARFKKLLAQAEAGPVKEELKKTVAAKQAQWDTLKKLRDTMSRGQLQLEKTLASMGTVYMQVKLLGSKEVDSSRARRLQEDMTEQVHALADMRAAMEELYQVAE